MRMTIRQLKAEIVDDALRQRANLGRQNAVRWEVPRRKRLGVLDRDRREQKKERLELVVVTSDADAVVKLVDERVKLGRLNLGKFRVQISHSVANGPNDLKLSDCGARRGSCVVRRRESIRATEKGGSDERLSDKK